MGSDCDVWEGGWESYPVSLSRELEQVIGRYRVAQLLNGRRLLVKANGKLQQEKLLQLTSLGGSKVRVHIPEVAASLRGVITNVPLDVSMDELKTGFRGGVVLEARRLQTRKGGGEKVDSLSVLLEFGEVLPKDVQLGYVNYRVTEFVPLPMRCYRWQRMGHPADLCRGKIRCSRCGGEHDYSQCEKNDT